MQYVNDINKYMEKCSGQKVVLPLGSVCPLVLFTNMTFTDDQILGDTYKINQTIIHL